MKSPALLSTLTDLEDYTFKLIQLPNRIVELSLHYDNSLALALGRSTCSICTDYWLLPNSTARDNNCEKNLDVKSFPIWFFVVFWVAFGALWGDQRNRCSQTTVQSPLQGFCN